jgi:hypothetical protein
MFSYDARKVNKMMFFLILLFFTKKSIFLGLTAFFNKKGCFFGLTPFLLKKVSRNLTNLKSHPSELFFMISYDTRKVNKTIII